MIDWDLFEKHKMSIERDGKYTCCFTRDHTEDYRMRDTAKEAYEAAVAAITTPPEIDWEEFRKRQGEMYTTDDGYEVVLKIHGGCAQASRTHKSKAAAFAAALKACRKHERKQR